MLQNAYFLAKIGADTAENEQHFAEILPADAHHGEPVRRAGADPGAARFGHAAVCALLAVTDADADPRGPGEEEG